MPVAESLAPTVTAATPIEVIAGDDSVLPLPDPNMSGGGVSSNGEEEPAAASGAPPAAVKNAWAVGADGADTPPVPAQNRSTFYPDGDPAAEQGWRSGAISAVVPAVRIAGLGRRARTVGRKDVNFIPTERRIMEKKLTVTEIPEPSIRIAQLLIIVSAVLYIFGVGLKALHPAISAAEEEPGWYIALNACALGLILVGGYNINFGSANFNFRLLSFVVEQTVFMQVFGLAIFQLLSICILWQEPGWEFSYVIGELYVFAAIFIWDMIDMAISTQYIYRLSVTVLYVAGCIQRIVFAYLFDPEHVVLQYNVSALSHGGGAENRVVSFTSNSIHASVTTTLLAVAATSLTTVLTDTNNIYMAVGAAYVSKFDVDRFGGRRQWVRKLLYERDYATTVWRGPPNGVSVVLLFVVCLWFTILVSELSGVDVPVAVHMCCFGLLVVEVLAFFHLAPHPKQVRLRKNKKMFLNMSSPRFRFLVSNVTTIFVFFFILADAGVVFLALANGMAPSYYTQYCPTTSNAVAKEILSQLTITCFLLFMVLFDTAKFVSRYFCLAWTVVAEAGALITYIFALWYFEDSVLITYNDTLPPQFDGYGGSLTVQDLRKQALLSLVFLTLGSINSIVKDWDFGECMIFSSSLVLRSDVIEIHKDREVTPGCERRCEQLCSRCPAASVAPLSDEGEHEDEEEPFEPRPRRVGHRRSRRSSLGYLFKTKVVPQHEGPAPKAHRNVSRGKISERELHGSVGRRHLMDNEAREHLRRLLSEDFDALTAAVLRVQKLWRGHMVRVLIKDGILGAIIKWSSPVIDKTHIGQSVELQQVRQFKLVKFESEVYEVDWFQEPLPNSLTKRLLITHVSEDSAIGIITLDNGAMFSCPRVFREGCCC